MTNDLIGQLRELMEDAHQLPWTATSYTDAADGSTGWEIQPVDDAESDDPASWEAAERASAALIVAAVNALPELLDTIRTLTDERDAAIRALDAERSSRPKAGLWLVEELSGGRSMRWIAAGDVPDPLPVAQLERHREAMQRAAADALNLGWRSDGQGSQYRILPSAARLVDALIAAVAAEMEAA